MNAPNNTTRQSVFVALVNADDPQTPSDVGEAVGETRQSAKYHIDKLVDQGLVRPVRGGYRPQPVFTDEDFEEVFVEWLGDLLPEVAERIEIDQEATGEEWAAAVYNCVRMYVAMEVLGGSGEKEPSAAGRVGD